MTISAIRQSAVGLRHANLIRGLPTGPSAFERVGTLKATDPPADIERDLKETRAIIAEVTEQVAQGGEVEKYARGMLRLMNRRRSVPPLCDCGRRHRFCLTLCVQPCGRDGVEGAGPTIGNTRTH